MSFTRIFAIMLQEFYVTKRSLEVIVDLFYFSIVNIVVFGFFSLFLLGGANKQAAHYLLMGMIMWEIVRVTQYSVSVGSLWNIWSRNLSNMFISPLTLPEYIIADMASGVIKALIIFFVISLFAIGIFHFDIFTIGILTLAVGFLNLTIFSWSAGIFVLALIFRYGQKIQALAWGLIFIFQPLTAAFFPVSVLPLPVQYIAYILPATYVFEAGRASLSHAVFNWQMAGISFIENIFYFILAIYYFKNMFKKSKESGQFAKNES